MRTPMTQIEFYTLEPTSPGDRYLLVCRLAERALGLGLRVLIHCSDGDQARHLDRLLWNYREDSFLPHGPVHRADPPTDLGLTPILIGQDGTPETEDQILVNLTPGVPGFFERFQRVWEPLDQDPETLAAGRDRFRAYRDRGYPPEHRKVDIRTDPSGW
jgi:DNA polymerase-3 subunit chi